MLRANTLIVGPLETNCYLVTPQEDNGDVIVVDPGAEPAAILDCIGGLELKIAGILLTHGHVDHMAGAAAIRAGSGAKVYIHMADADMLRKPDPYWASLVGGAEACDVDAELADGQQLDLAGLSISVIHTPGHSPGSVCYRAGDTLLSGDTLFAGSMGRTDLPGGDPRAMKASLARLVAEFAGKQSVQVLPGHGPSTTMADELRSNPFLQDLPQV